MGIFGGGTPAVRDQFTGVAMLMALPIGVIPEEVGGLIAKRAFVAGAATLFSDVMRRDRKADPALMAQGMQIMMGGWRPTAEELPHPFIDPATDEITQLLSKGLPLPDPFNDIPISASVMLMSEYLIDDEIGPEARQELWPAAGAFVDALAVGLRKVNEACLTDPKKNPESQIEWAALLTSRSLGEFKIQPQPTL